jgi:bifunctional DNA-binding transcriptional regulator/antitoxin component of YhaV-PrlF toxin-antitoxin module
MPSNVVTVQSTKLGQLVITIPRALAEMKGWKKGTKLAFKEDRFGALTITEVEK